VPALFAHGSRDPFGSLEEIEAARALIPSPTALVAVPGAGHDLYRAPTRTGLTLAEEIATAFLTLVA
jgi:hypothetical protein